MLSLGLCVLGTLSLLAGLHPAFELATHFAMHATLLGILLLPLLMFFQRRWLALFVAVVLAYLLFLTQPWALLARSTHVASTESRTLRVLSWNLLSVNRSFAEIRNIVAEADPDLIVFIEVRPGLLDALPDIVRDYPYMLERPSWGGEGIALLSRVEGIELEIVDFEFARQPAIVAQLPSAQDDQGLQFVAMHTLSPVPLHRAQFRDRQLSALAEWAESTDSPICVCGDLNITPWAGAFRRLIDVGFRDSRLGSGNGASWPSFLGALGIPIDHALAKGQCRISERRVLASGPGSDHLPLAFTLHY